MSEEYKRGGVERILKSMSEEGAQAWVSDSMQVADVVEWMLKQMPEGEEGVVWQSTFSISEEYLRRIHFMQERHPGWQWNLVIDRKALNKIVQLWRMIDAVYDSVWLTDNHSKVVVVESKDGSGAVMLTSQNLTRGNRNESGVVTLDVGIRERILKDLKYLTEKKSMDMSDLLPATMEDAGEIIEMAHREDGHGEDTVCEDIERLAGIFVPLSDIAVICEINEGELRDAVADPSHPWSRAYRRGKAKAKAEMRSQEMALAKLGSPFGMQNVRDNLLAMEAEE